MCASPHVLRTTALALSFSAASEYACPVWERSAHASHLDPVLNKTCRLITGCVKPTNTNNLHLLAGISPRDKQRSFQQARTLKASMRSLSHVDRLQARSTIVKIKKKLSTQRRSSRGEDYELERGRIGKKVKRVATKQSFEYQT